MGVSANDLSRQIQQLEEDLGVRLLQRTTRWLGLTSTGRALVDGAEPALARLDALWSAKAGLGAALVPQRLAGDSISAGLLVHVMKEYFSEREGHFAVYSSRRHPTAAIRAFLDFVVEESRIINAIG
jgi:DNA-binding transcriptional LysR family regulator